jgi:protein phosphatase inhibitor 2
MSTEIIPDQPHLPPLPRSASNPRPKGILKNALPPPGSAQQTLRWDEANIQSTEFPEGTFTKITEPKTPYVRYNAETDEVEGGE